MRIISMITRRYLDWAISLKHNVFLLDFYEIVTVIFLDFSWRWFWLSTFILIFLTTLGTFVLAHIIYSLFVFTIINRLPFHWSLATFFNWFHTTQSLITCFRMTILPTISLTLWPLFGLFVLLLGWNFERRQHDFIAWCALHKTHLTVITSDKLLLLSSRIKIVSHLLLLQGGGHQVIFGVITAW